MMSDKERLMRILNVPIYPHQCVNPVEAVADLLLDNGVTFATDAKDGHNRIRYEDRCMIYTNALIQYGDQKQMIVAIEELSECQKELCKIMRGGEDFSHLAEEIADATIMLEQMRLAFNINDKVCEYMDTKVRRLDENLRRNAYGG
jgi:hypothetical protein